MSTTRKSTRGGGRAESRGFGALPEEKPQPKRDSRNAFDRFVADALITDEGVE